ncbi:NERD domain-containing protein [Clostridium sp. UBA3887]|uniref:NERD domain-containing protein n=1 Tax=Clostridium sp. UBA3887 TaxID=1946356 RepID=UPI0032177408
MNYGVFVIETKNYKGRIIGNEFDEYWKQRIYSYKKDMYNPIRQNYGHIQALKKILGDFPDVNYIPIVVFTINADLKVKCKTDVIYTINLLKTIKKYNKQTLRDSVKKPIYSKLISLSIDGKENRKAHIAQNQNRLIDNKNKISNDICPRCGGKLVLRKGKYGEFKGCSNYPKCRFILK